MTSPPKSPRRLLIGAGSFADAQAALRLAERLAETLSGDLGGLLVEETVVTEIVDRPGQRVVTSSGTVVVAPSPRQVRTLMESDARAFRDSLSGLARARTRKWSFERRQGDLIGGLRESARGWDVLLLGHRPMHQRAGRVVLISPPGGAARDAADLAHDLARALRTDLVALSFGPETAETSATPATPKTPAAPAADEPRGEHEHFASEPALLARLGRLNATAVVLDLAAGPLRSYDQLRRLLDAARCPVLVFGAAGGEMSIGHTTQIPPAP